MTLSIVIPVYNEEENVRLLHEKIREALSHVKQAYEIIFVDDGSTDNTLSILEEIQGKDTRVVVLSLRRKEINERIIDCRSAIGFEDPLDRLKAGLDDLHRV